MKWKLHPTVPTAASGDCSLPLAAFCKQFVLEQGFEMVGGFLMSQTLAMVTWQKHLLAAERRLWRRGEQVQHEGLGRGQERGQ